MNASMEALQERVATLERTIKLLLLTIGISLAGVALVATDGPNVIQASAFELVSQDGDVRAELVVESGQPFLNLKDSNGVNRLSLFHEADASGLYIMDAESVTRIGVAQFAHGGGGVALHGPNSKGAAVLYLKDTGSLRFFDSDGTVTNQMLGTPSEKVNRPDPEQDDQEE